MNNILLIPGSFNPITNAHIEMAETARKAVNAKTVYFIPAHDTYVARKRFLIPGNVRCRLIDEGTPEYMGSLSIEINHSIPGHTINTVRKIKSMFEFHNFFICFGMDSIKTFTLWYNWRKFIEENTFVACVRSGENLETALKEANLEKYKNHFIEIEISKNNISSSLVRELCGQSKFDEAKKLVPENVYEYLRRLYNVLNEI